MKKYSFEIHFKSGRIVKPKGFYYQGKNDIVIVGNTETNSTVRERVDQSDIKEIILTENER